MRKPGMAAVTFCMALFMALPSVGQVLLKPAGQNAVPLKTKALSADVGIQGQFADTTLHLTFQNETAQRIEADFFYTIPADSAVTYFAYWFGEEKVVARVVEKERASAIYSHITSRMRDPALIEMVGKNRFRARIFPVMPHADLKVEMRMVQTLPSDSQGASFTLPMEQPRGEPLQSIHVNVRVKPDASIARVENNLGLSVLTDSEGYRIHLEGTNYRPQKDLRVRLIRSPKPLHAAMYAARSGGVDGFFALALTPGMALRNPEVRIEGARVFEVAPVRLRSAAAHAAIGVYGRYRGSGAATVRLSGKGSRGRVVLTAPVHFSQTAEPNNLAAKLWAYHRIQELSARDSSRERVTALSIRHTIPSRFTSWLAVPAAEMERYRREKDEAELEAAAARLIQEIDAGRGRGRAAVFLRERLSALARKLDRRPDETLRAHLAHRLYEMGRPIAEARVREEPIRPALRAKERRFRAFCLKFGIAPEQSLTEMREQAAYSETGRVAERLARAIFEGREADPATVRLRSQLDRLSALTRQDPRQQLQACLSGRTSPLAEKVVRAERAGQGESDEIMRIRARLERVERAAGIPRGATIRDARFNVSRQALYEASRRVYDALENGRDESEPLRDLREKLEELREIVDGGPSPEAHRPYLHGILQQAGYALADEAAAGREDGPKALRTRRLFTEVSRMAGLDPEEQLRNVLQYRIQDAAWQLARERDRPNPDETRLPELETRLQRLARLASMDALLALEQAEASFRQGEANALRRRLIAERRAPHPDPALIRRLEEEFRRLYGDDRYVSWRIERIAVETEIDRLEKAVPQDPAVRQRLARLQEQAKTLRARMGDPLIQVDAPPDAERVVAVLPSGEIKSLRYNAESERWEARFDIPAYASEGEYLITLIIITRDGERKTLVMRYHVDVTPPRARASAAQLGSALRLEIETDDHAARAAAILPWGERVELRASTAPNRFFGLATVPADFRGDLNVVYIVTDRAHNRTAIRVEAGR